MKTSKLFLATILMLSFSLMSMKCDDDGPREGEEMDTDGPEITINTPNANSVFYTEGGVDSPDYIVIAADATDDSKIIKGSVTVLDESNQQAWYYEETSATQNGISITSIYTSFSTLQPGQYTLKFEFEDVIGNLSTVNRTVTCEYSENSGGTDS